MYLCFKVCPCKHLDNPNVKHWQPLSKCCTDCLPLTYLHEYSSSAHIMQRVTVLVLVLMWCTQTVHAQQGQWKVLDNYILHIRTITKGGQIMGRLNVQRSTNLYYLYWSSKMALLVQQHSRNTCKHTLHYKIHGAPATLTSGKRGWTSWEHHQTEIV